MSAFLYLLPLTKTKYYAYSIARQAEKPRLEAALEFYKYFRKRVLKK